MSTRADLTPGEVCTVDVARSAPLNITSIGDFFRGTPKVMTYNPSWDTRGPAPAYRLCDVNTTTNTGYPICELSSNIGAGVGFRQSDTSSDVCVATQCPQGFTLSNGICTTAGLLNVYKANRHAFAQERWGDWMVIPNFHLGNEYGSNATPTYDSHGIITSNIITAYAPCSNSDVPLYRNDPVDGDSMGDEIDKLDRCISKNQYFYQKYAKTDDYCPITNIHRFTLNVDDVKTSLGKIMTANTNPTVAFANMYSSDGINTMAQHIVGSNENIAIPNKVTPLDQYGQNACSSLETPERVEFAYKQCSNLFLKSNAGENVASLFANTNNSTDKAKIMKQSCNALFCTEGSTAYGSGGSDPICFKPSEIASTVVVEPIDDPYADKFLKPPEQAIGLYTTIPAALKRLVSLLLLPFCLVFLFYAYKNGWRWVCTFYSIFIQTVVYVVDVCVYYILHVFGLGGDINVKDQKYALAKQKMDTRKLGWEIADIIEDIRLTTNQLKRTQAYAQADAQADAKAPAPAMTGGGRKVTSGGRVRRTDIRLKSKSKRK